MRYSVLDLQGGDQVGLTADSFPPKDVTSTKYYLDGLTRTLTTEVPRAQVSAAYDVASNPNAVSFITRFDEETVMVGYPKAHLWVEARGSDDMDLFVLVQKLDAWETPLQAVTVPNQSAIAHDLTDHEATILRCKGSDGRLRVSARNLDEDLSSEDVPDHTFDRVEKLAPEQIVKYRDRPITDRPRVPRRGAAALHHQLRKSPRNVDAWHPQVRRRQCRPACDSHGRRARVVPAAPDSERVTRAKGCRIQRAYEKSPTRRA